MGGLKKEKGQSGAVTQFLSRKQAMRRLQLSLPNFRRLCIWKGIHAVAPGSALTKDGKEKMWFARKDIARICADPILDLMRQERVEGERIRRSKARKEGRIVRRVRAHQSVMDGHLARMVRERWPTRESALQAVGEAIGTVLIVAHLPTLTQFPGAYIHRCRRLMLELYQYVIRTRAVRHAYISVKGVYVQASLDGVPVTWIAPHDHASATVPPELDYRMLAIAMRLDSILLQSVLTGLYEKAGLVYPPKFDCPIGTELSERDLLANMAVPLASIDSNGVSMGTDDRPAGDEESAAQRLLASMDGDAALAADQEVRVSRVRRLFAGHTVFVSREVPRDVFVLLTRACGADKVSWDESCCAGAPLPASSPAITLHVSDRDALGAEAAVSRAYVQPQYLVDSINAARLLPVADYLPGQRLVAHVSPFAADPADAEHERYCPPEMRYLRGEIAADQLYHYSEDEDDDQENQEIIEEMEEDEEDEDDDENDAKDTEPVAPVAPPSNNKNKSVKSQKNRVSREELDKKIEQNKQRKLLEMSLPKKRRNLYNKMKFAENKRQSQLDKMADKRRQANRARSAQSEK